jgi:hypothetical protein
MPENDSFGPNEAIWREYSAKVLSIALGWPEEKLFRFTQHQKFENLIPADQEIIWQKLHAKLAAAAALPMPVSAVSLLGAAEQAPIAPEAPSTPKPRTPVPIAPATRSASPRLSWTEGEFAHALWRATLYWLSIMAVGSIALKLLTGR